MALEDDDHTYFPIEEYDQFYLPMRVSDSHLSLDSLDMVFPLDEAILEAMTCIKKPWEEMHHGSYFLSYLSRMEDGNFSIIMSRYFSCYVIPLMTRDVYDEKNMEKNISKTMPKYLQEFRCH
jgi:hypothetical protein